MHFVLTACLYDDAACGERTGRFGTRGVAVTFVQQEYEAEFHKLLRSRKTAATLLPDTIDASMYNDDGDVDGDGDGDGDGDKPVADPSSLSLAEDDVDRRGAVGGISFVGRHVATNEDTVFNNDGAVELLTEGGSTTSLSRDATSANLRASMMAEVVHCETLYNDADHDAIGEGEEEDEEDEENVEDPDPRDHLFWRGPDTIKGINLVSDDDSVCSGNSGNGSHAACPMPPDGDATWSTVPVLASRQLVDASAAEAANPRASTPCPPPGDVVWPRGALPRDLSTHLLRF